ncbi:MAG: hypothetical protein ACXVFL_14835 [Solirubrobacteraceae bacterium]
MSGIGVLREGPLHAALKDFYARPGDRAEVPFGRFVVDLVRADGELVEIQTGGFSPLGPKLDALLDHHRMRIVHPVAAERRIVRIDEAGEVLSARRSPRRAGALEVFDRLVSFPSLLAHPNLTVEVPLCREDHVRAPGPTRSRSGRRTRDPGQRRLAAVLDTHVFAGPGDVAALLPAELGDGPFTTRELGEALGCRLVLAQRVAYCMRTLGVVADAGRRGPAPLHVRAP